MSWQTPDTYHTAGLKRGTATSNSTRPGTTSDRLTVEASAHFAAQLPDLIRGIFYAGWNPSAVPENYDAEAYAARFAREANISLDDVGKAAAATTAAVLHHLPPPQMDKALDQLPREIRALLQAQR